VHGIGQYGEGLKGAASVFVRNDCRFEIHQSGCILRFGRKDDSVTMQVCSKPRSETAAVKALRALLRLLQSPDKKTVPEAFRVDKNRDVIQVIVPTVRANVQFFDEYLTFWGRRRVAPERGTRR
jgi:hypothetical protein